MTIFSLNFVLANETFEIHGFSRESFLLEIVGCSDRRSKGTRVASSATLNRGPLENGRFQSAKFIPFGFKCKLQRKLARHANKITFRN